MGIAILKLLCVQFRSQQMSKYSDAFGGPDFPHREKEMQHMEWGEGRTYAICLKLEISIWNHYF